MFERRHTPLIPRRRFYRRVARSFGIAALLVAVSLGLGTLGYFVTESLEWLDAFLNASLILTGMGPLHSPVTGGGKLFVSIYALFSGVVFLTASGLLIAPVAHRFLHHFHVMEEEKEDRKPGRR